MTPQAALHDDIFRTYLYIVLAILGVAGVVLSVLRFGLKKEIRSVWLTYRSWLMMAPLIFGSIFAGRIVVIVFFCVLAGLAFKEFARATGLYRDWWTTGAVYLGIIAVGITCLMRQPQGEESGAGWYNLFIVLPIFAVALIFLIPIVRNEVKGQLQTVALAIVGFIYIGWMFGHLAFLANSRYAYGYLLYVLFATEINDVAAFTFGKLFGKRKFRSNISPKKTWAGSLGALGVSMALPWLLHFSFPHFGAVQLILAGLIVGLGGQLGDLAISVIKRDIGIKDMGANIPGHGGILDRIDSLIYVAPLFFHMANYFYPMR
jgi:Predicted CDP-diglyceride synthetase/phosphatidate cytidylyltransferase